MAERAITLQGKDFDLVFRITSCQQAGMLSVLTPRGYTALRSFCRPIDVLDTVGKLLIQVARVLEGINTKHLTS